MYRGKHRNPAPDSKFRTTHTARHARPNLWLIHVQIALGLRRG